MSRLAVSLIPQSALRQLSREGLLYAILDACDAPSVIGKVRELKSTSLCLYREPADKSLLSIAPYLAAVDESLFDWIINTIWQEPWGIFALSKSELRVVGRHFRKFLTVKSPEGEPWYFRYYDPRVIATFLPSCSASELDEFFGPVAAYAFTDGQDNIRVAELVSN